MTFELGFFAMDLEQLGEYLFHRGRLVRMVFLFEAAHAAQLRVGLCAFAFEADGVDDFSFVTFFARAAEHRYN